MIRKATTMALRQNLGEILNGVQYKGNTVLITKSGKSVAALVDMDLFEKIRRMKDQFSTLTSELAASYKDKKKAFVEAEIAEAIKETRKK